MKSILESHQEYLSADDVLLVPKMGILKSRKDAQLASFIYSAPMDTVTGFDLAKAMLDAGEIPVICREISDKEYVKCLRAFYNTEAFFALGATEKELERFFLRFTQAKSELPETVYINIALDIAHGDSVVAYDAARFIKANWSFINSIMSGSICTPEAAGRCWKAGFTHLRIGIGPGSMCTTRLMTGCGVPQLSAVHEIASYFSDHHFFADGAPRPILIADGGIRYPGDAVKYLAAGANAVMMGSVFSQAKESLGWQEAYPRENLSNQVLSFPLKSPEPVLVKQYRGHASDQFQLTHKGEASPCPEGVSSDVFEWNGQTVSTIIEKFKGGVASAISYLGLTKIEELHPANVTFIRITQNGLIESKSQGK